ncbi:putative purine phosphoribosyltransferase [Gordonia polyisoprenivorans NBRC 16320 = JCM 10675]|uniref:Phosphoribosyltransferase n=1 Tax=Gordonia polyisoprenivorans TaxID=84595 RepID=A0A846WMN9_9ACTN|nr:MULTISPECIES: phosphoribosyltransferase [Gordonia]MBE7194946.1 phosphoribosyltransferase [Gordonia polyisoprenivorans]MDF3281788.1 phosphoribosyltransferase [Gordonia sp. N1V]NKY02286.1 phosphoribosyltransferase [Gordonia polyisoprenivorans]OPX15441.1 phosphoribosyltransferase [Gordonia sp. i37]OZC30429.1 phosphoribosyltransferase [Gordonia polyisoprenivorans]
MNASATTPPAPDEREKLTWEMNGRACRDLAQQIADDGFVPDIILGIARGGLIPAGAIAYALDCKLMISLNVAFYTGIGETLAEPVMLPSLLESSGLHDQKVLVVDDVADSGKTLALVDDFCEHQGRVAEVRNAVIYQKPHTITTPDYCWRTTAKWIDFPWSVEPPVTGAAEKP